MFTTFLGWLLLAALISPVLASASPEALSFTSGGKAIAADLYAPATPGPHPVVLVLHGAGGMIFDGPEMKRVAQRLAAAGDTVYLVHYFNRTATVASWDSLMQAHFEEWYHTVRDAVDWARARAPGAVKPPVGIFGYSLGAFLAVAAASDDPGVSAVVEQDGGVWNNRDARIGKMPPVLVIHGTADERVPLVQYSKPLIALLRRRGGFCQVHDFPGEGHRFDATAAARVREEAAAFFAKELSPAPPLTQG